MISRERGTLRPKIVPNTSSTFASSTACATITAMPYRSCSICSCTTSRTSSAKRTVAVVDHRYLDWHARKLQPPTAAIRRR